MVALIAPYSIIETYLRTADTDLYSLVGTRIYVTPPGWKFPQDRSLTGLSFEVLPVGGPVGSAKPDIPIAAGGRAPIERLYVEIRAWANDPATAMTAARTLHNTIDGATRQTVTVSGTDYLIVAVTRTGPPVGLPPFEDRGWHAVLTTYQFDLYPDPYTGS